mmetsp:Transcript_56571/g.132488  ORF Transcript_56571/g.132488 Transcript_56571/m.132488 type:complete len:391 (+) Transcript_56571:310-1482(+)
MLVPQLLELFQQRRVLRVHLLVRLLQAHLSRQPLLPLLLRTFLLRVRRWREPDGCHALRGRFGRFGSSGREDACARGSARRRRGTQTAARGSGGGGHVHASPERNLQAVLWVARPWPLALSAADRTSSSRSGSGLGRVLAGSEVQAAFRPVHSHAVQRLRELFLELVENVLSVSFEFNQAQLLSKRGFLFRGQSRDRPRKVARVFKLLCVCDHLLEILHLVRYLLQRFDAFLHNKVGADPGTRNHRPRRIRSSSTAIRISSGRSRRDSVRGFRGAQPRRGRIAVACSSVPCLDAVGRNLHCLSHVVCWFEDATHLSARVVGRNPSYNLALLHDAVGLDSKTLSAFDLMAVVHRRNPDRFRFSERFLLIVLFLLFHLCTRISFRKGDVPQP